MASIRTMDLASIIMASTARFDVFIESLNLSSPSFDASAFANPPPKELQGARTAIVEAISLEGGLGWSLPTGTMSSGKFCYAVLLDLGYIVNSA